MEFITIFSSGNKGNSRKPGNIFLNWGKLFDLIPDVAVAGAGIAEAPTWVVAFIALYIWNKLWRSATEDFSDAEATTILTLWKSRNDSQKIAEFDGLKKTNMFRRESGLEELSEAHYRAVVDRLIKLECIEMQNGMIWLREWVRVSYN